jgi:hypothetical protein
MQREVGAPQVRYRIDVRQVRADEQRGRGVTRAAAQAAFGQRGPEEGVRDRIQA